MRFIAWLFTFYALFIGQAAYVSNTEKDIKAFLLVAIAAAAFHWAADDRIVNARKP